MDVSTAGWVGAESLQRYPGMARVGVTVPGSTNTVVVPSPVTITADASGSVDFSGTAGNGTLVAGTLTWRCSD